MAAAVLQASFRFYAELNDFLPPEKRAQEFDCFFNTPQSVKHLIESCGVPHTEVDLVLVNGRSEDFSAVVSNGDRVSVYPVFEAFDISGVSRVRPEPLRRIRFVADAHLGRLAVYLRMFGFDTLYYNDAGDEELAGISSRQRRVLLTRDRELLKRREITHGCCVRESAFRAQLIEVLERFDLAASVLPFSRCLRCNGTLEEISRPQARPHVPLRSLAYADRFQRCRLCGRVYWNGSHYRRMQRYVEGVMSRLWRERGS